MNSRSFTAWTLGICLTVLMCGRPGFGQSDLPEANPARPTVANPATLTPVGYLQFETGLLYAEGSGDFSGRLALEQVTKLTVHPRFELQVQSEPFVYSGVQGVRGTAPGDVLAGAQFVILPGRESRPTVSLAYFKHVYASSAPDLDTGTPEHSLVLLISDDLHGFHFDINGMFNEQKEGNQRRAQFGQTVSTSYAFGRFTLASEVWHFTQPLTRGNAVGNLWALSFAPRKNLVFDAGFNRGLTSTSTQWETFAGFTYVLPHRLWKEHRKGIDQKSAVSSGSH